MHIIWTIYIYVSMD